MNAGGNDTGAVAGQVESESPRGADGSMRPLWSEDRGAVRNGQREASELVVRVPSSTESDGLTSARTTMTTLDSYELAANLATNFLELVLFKEGSWGFSDESLFRMILVNNGIIDEEVLEHTPRRWIKALKDSLACDCDTWKFTTFESDSDEMVIVRDIDFTTLCAHHLLPFFGRAHVAYIPQGRIAGLSKLARAVRTATKGLWAQEELTRCIANELEEALAPKGVAVVLEAEHTCMTTRGVRAPDSKTTTSAMLGVFRDNTNNARAEFLSLMR